MQHYELSNDFIRDIIRISGGYLRHEDLDEFFDSLKKETKKYFFTRSAENNLIRIVQASFDRSMILRDFSRYRLMRDILLSASVNSNYICDILVRDPENFYWAANPTLLNTSINIEGMRRQIRQIFSHYSGFSAKLNALKSLKRKEILRIALQDLLGIFDLQEITKELSSLAEAVLGSLFSLCINEIEKKHGIKMDLPWCIVSLGKLGGHELNYSSDTDLIIFYHKDKKTGKKYYSELLTEAVKLFIESSSRFTDNGYLYRIDFRLRPDGRNSELCRSLTEYLSYYETRGEQWERQMLIKASFLTGNKDLYNEFITYLSPFIYPSSHLSSPAEEVRRLKASIEKNLKDELNIKLTKGGIRDIEFSVQVLQLLNGGKNKKLRTGNTVKAIEELSSAGLITLKEKTLLASAYFLFRRTEHYLQLMNDRQTHTVPESGELAEKLAAYLKFRSVKDFLADINEKRNAVRKIYLSIIPGASENQEDRVIFARRQESERLLSFLREGKDLTGEKAFDQQTQNAYLQFEPVLLRQLKDLPDPDLVLRNLVLIIRSTEFPSIWYNEMLDETFCRYVLLLCAYSGKAVNLIMSSPKLQDIILTRKVFSGFDHGEILRSDINVLLLYLTSWLALNKIEPGELSGMLAGFCKYKISEAAERILGRENYFIAGMGSLGSGEMTFGSDLDIIYVVKKSSLQAEKNFQKLLLAVNKELGPFKTDCRLRPEGKGSQLAWELNTYKKYFDMRARIWELQAFCRISFIAGDESMYNDLLLKIEQRISKENCDRIKSSIAEMRIKMLKESISIYSKNQDIKRIKGGLTDIEFLLQYLILCTPNFYINLTGRNTGEIVDSFIPAGEKFSELEKLKSTEAFLKKIELAVQSAFDTDKTYFPGEENKKKLISAYLKMKPSELDKNFREALRLNITLFEKYFA